MEEEGWTKSAPGVGEVLVSILYGLSPAPRDFPIGKFARRSGRSDARRQLKICKYQNNGDVCSGGRNGA